MQVWSSRWQLTLPHFPYKPLKNPSEFVHVYVSQWNSGAVRCYKIQKYNHLASEISFGETRLRRRRWIVVAIPYIVLFIFLELGLADRHVVIWAICTHPCDYIIYNPDDCQIANNPSTEPPSSATAASNYVLITMSDFAPSFKRSCIDTAVTYYYKCTKGERTQ